MALRGTGFAKRPAGPVTVPASAAGRAVHDAEPSVHAIPLDLAPLISPYRGQGRISLRVERLPHRTRLSRGQNNGDRSWSLVLDDLEGLQFLAPRDLVGEQRLSIRVVSLDGGDGATIAVLEHSISPHDSPRITAVDGGRAVQDSGPDRAQTERLRIELAEAKAARAAQETMLADVRQGLESDWELRARQMVQVELATAKSAWEAETKQQLVELARREAANLEQSQRTWQAEEESRLVKAELEYRRELEKERQLWHKEFEGKLAQLERDAKASEAARLAAEDKFRLLASKGETYERARSEFEADLAKAKAAWKESEAGRMAEAQDQWQVAAVTAQNDAHERLRREFEAELAKVQRIWKDGEASRLAAAKSEWQAQTEKALAESRSLSSNEAEILRSKTESEWQARTHARVAESQAAWQQQSAKALAEERARAEKELQVALEAAQRVWKTGEAARLAAAEAKWHEESARLMSQARNGDNKADDAGQIDGLRDELAVASATLANREAELAQLRQNLEHAGDGARRDVEVALADARKSWSEDEAERLATARAQWNEQTSKELAHARTLLETSASEEARELNQAREELTLAKTALAEREGELQQAQRAAQIESEQLRREAEVAMEQARDQWNAEEAGRLATVEAKWREQFASSQVEHGTHAEQQPSEHQAPSDPVAETPALRDSVEVLRLRDDVERLKQKMAIREVELAQARATAEQARARLTGEPLDLLTRQHSDRVLISTGRNRSLPRQTRKKMPWRDIGIVAAVAVAIFVFYPHIMALLPYDWFPDSSVSDDVEPAPTKPVASAKPAALPIESQPTDIITKSANVRSAPVKTASLVSTLGANVAVHTLERRGNWVHIAFAAGTAKEDGWVYATYLQALQAAPAVPAGAQ